MTDLIERQAAIEVAMEEIESGTYFDIPSKIKNLPPVQPEIIRCKDCEYQNKGQNESETWNLCGYRPWQYTPTTDEHFCSYAERREE